MASASVVAVVALYACAPVAAVLDGVSALGNGSSKQPKTAVVCDDVHGADCGTNTATVRVDNGQ